MSDEEGVELPDLHAAHREAMMRLGEMLQAQPELFCEDADMQLVLCDQANMTLLTLEVSATRSPAFPPWRPH